MPIEVWNEDTQEFKSRPIVLQISRNLTAFMTFLIQLIREILLGELTTPLGVVIFENTNVSYTRSKCDVVIADCDMG